MGTKYFIHILFKIFSKHTIAKGLTPVFVECLFLLHFHT